MARPALPTGLQALKAVMASTSAGALRGRRLLGLAALVGLPLLIQIIVLIWGEGRGSGFTAFVFTFDTAYLRIIVPLALIFLGTAAFGDEWEGGTANYIVGAPIPREAIVLGRWLVSALRALLLLLPALCVLYLLTLAPHEGAPIHYLPELLKVLVGISLAVLAYTAVFVFLGLWLRRSVMTALGYVLIFEVFIGSLPLGFSAISLAFHNRNLLWHMTGQEGFLPNKLDVETIDPTSWASSLIWIVGYQVVFLALATVVLKRKEFTGGGEAATPGTTGA
jgi:ABC-type transport system involved in multi-copper enzyme maturation permease subunit